MDYRIKCLWNGKMVMDGQSTRVMAYDTLRSFMGDSFAGVEHKAWCDQTLYPIMREFLAYGAPFVCAYADDTGSAGIEVERV